MKVLLILEASGGGTGRHIIDLANYLIKSGCSVTLVYSSLRALPDFYQEISLIPGLTVLKVDMCRPPHPSDIIALFKLRNIIKKYGPFDVIHGHSSKGGALARLASIGLPGIRVYTPHAFRTIDPSLNVILYKLYSFIERLLFRISDAIILVSEGEKRHALQIGLPESKLFVIENGMDEQKFASTRETLRNRLHISQDDLCIGFVGRFVPQKAPDCLIKAFALIADKYPNARLIMLGDGLLQSDLHTLSGQLEIRSQIIWLENENGAEFMSLFDIFVMPSLYEAFPYVLLEAANAGLPIIATPVGGTDEMLIDQVNGFLVNHNEPVKIAEALESLINNPKLRSQMGKASRTIGQKYSVNVMADKTLTLYRDLLNQAN